MVKVHLNIEMYDLDFIRNGSDRPVKTVYVKLIILCFARTISEITCQYIKNVQTNSMCI